MSEANAAITASGAANGTPRIVSTMYVKKPAIAATVKAPAMYPPTAAPMWSSERWSRSRCSGGREERIASRHRCPLPSMNAVRIRIVSSAKTELTRPTPTLLRVLAAPPSRSGSFSASCWSLDVMA